MTTSTIWSSRSALGVLTAAMAGLLGGCSLVGSDTQAVYELLKTSWTGGSRVTLEEAAASPYASMGVRLGRSNEIMIILASDVEGEQLWTSAARIALVTKNGRIVRTSGFGHDLGGFTLQSETPGENGTTKVRWQGDFPELAFFSVAIECEDRPAGNETIVILGQDIHTQKVEETCSAQDNRLDWSFTNTYWRDPDSGLAWRSIQHVNPRLDPIETEILRPPG